MRLPDMSPDEIRGAALPTRRRGFDETATRLLLGRVAAIVEELATERDALRRELDHRAASAGAVDPVAIGNALITAQQAAETIVAEARHAASRIEDAARGQAEELIGQARQDAAAAQQQLVDRRNALEQDGASLRDELDRLQAKLDAERAAAHARLRAELEEQAARARTRFETLRTEEEALREFVNDQRRQFVEMLESTLAEIVRLHDTAHVPGDSEAELADLLVSRAADTQEPQEHPNGLRLAPFRVEPSDPSPDTDTGHS